MTEHVAFLIKDFVLFAASFYLLKEDVIRAALVDEPALRRNGDTRAVQVSAD